MGAITRFTQDSKMSFVTGCPATWASKASNTLTTSSHMSKMSKTNLSGITPATTARSIEQSKLACCSVTLNNSARNAARFSSLGMLHSVILLKNRKASCRSSNCRYEGNPDAATDLYVITRAGRDPRPPRSCNLIFQKLCEISKVSRGDSAQATGVSPRKTFGITFQTPSTVKSTVDDLRGASNRSRRYSIIVVDSLVVEFRDSFTILRTSSMQTTTTSCKFPLAGGTQKPVTGCITNRRVVMT
mmetsp:Transcript_23026/g.55866  ORF Transcript_23026/g.55866 Transcript_23026/m.55866 type:complete len:244 (-) Transcript_23026:1299-2030(-)